MGQVLLVRDLHRGEELALKLLLPAPSPSPDLEQLRREFAVLCDLRHPGLAAARDFGYLGDRPFFTSEFIEGRPFSEMALMEEGDLLETARDLARTLSFLHRSDVLHLDVKPSNILAPRDRERGRAVLIDFGLVRRGIATPEARLVRGSLPFMAPERFQGGELGPWTDLYALGVTLYLLATGKLPRPVLRPREASPVSMPAWDPAPAPPSHRRRTLSRDLDRVILKLLALDPRARFASGADLLRALTAMGVPGAAAVDGTSCSFTVGRSAELAVVDAFLDRIQTGDTGPRVFFVTGPPGMGQTHLFREMRTRAQVRGLEFHLQTGFSGRTEAPGSLFQGLGASLSSTNPSSKAWAAFLERLSRRGGDTRPEATEGERRLRRSNELLHLLQGGNGRPVLLAVDGLQHQDEVSIALLIDLVRTLDRDRAHAPQLWIAVGYREEGTSLPLLRELTHHLMGEGASFRVALGPLGPEDSLLLHSSRGAFPPGPPDLRLYQETGGSPARITALVRSSVEEASGAIEDASEAGPNPAERRTTTFTSHEVILLLDALGRPASPAEIARVLGKTRAEALRDLEELRRRGMASETESPAGKGTWMPMPGGTAIAASSAPGLRRRIHHRAAIALLAAGKKGDGPLLVEAVRHFQAAGRRAAVARFGPEAVRFLKEGFQSRAALEMLEAIIEALPAASGRRFLETAMEMADLHARVGGLDEGIGVLRDALSRTRTLSGSHRGRAILRLASLHGRRGDFQRADILFQEGFRMAGAAAALSREERLFFMNERAALKAAAGDHLEARRLCGEALRLAGRSRSRGVREAALDVHATLANVALRRFEFDAAVRDYQVSLEIATALGALGSQATVLNNLGVVYNQSDRYPEAVRAFREAERICLKIDEGPSLASIHGNLGILHGKTGDFEAMERSLAEGDRLARTALGRRQVLFLEHARGLGLLHRGRFREARRHLESAVRLGSEVGDRHLVSFDEVYRAEALVFEGRYADALHALERLSAGGEPRARRAALTRLAYLLALLGGKETAEKTAGAALDGDAPGAAIPYLSAWDDLYLGWGLCLRGQTPDGLGHLGRAEDFFRRRGLVPALAVSIVAGAEARLLAGEREAAISRLASLTGSFPPRPEPRHGDFASAALPVLAARAILESGTKDHRAACGDLLAAAGPSFLGNPLPEWELRLEAVRAALGRDRVSPRDLDRRRLALAEGLPDALRREYLGDRRTRGWHIELRSPRRKPPAPGSPQREGESPATSTTAVHADPGTALLPAGADRPRRLLAARSPGMKLLLERLERLKDLELPVLIQGETGSGKELVARLIHEESRRARRPFQVVDCATLPAGLFEAQVFGARAGSFTDLTEDRAGVLSSAEGGTVLIDEIGEASLETQAKLLRVLSERTIRPLGSDREERIDVRFVCTTSRDIDAEVAQGRFRADLLHRIGAARLEVPPLRDRWEDFPLLMEEFLQEQDGSTLRVEERALERLREMPWPGNVRELRNFLARLRVEEPGPITARSVEAGAAGRRLRALLPRNLLAGETLTGLKDSVERDYLVFHLSRLGGDLARLSAFLGLSRRQLYRRLRRLGISR